MIFPILCFSYVIPSNWWVHRVIASVNQTWSELHKRAGSIMSYLINGLPQIIQSHTHQFEKTRNMQERQYGQFKRRICNTEPYICSHVLLVILTEVVAVRTSCPPLLKPGVSPKSAPNLPAIDPRTCPQTSSNFTTHVAKAYTHCVAPPVQCYSITGFSLSLCYRTGSGPWPALGLGWNEACAEF